jgi:CheY-like chemotaxis protein
VSGRVVFCPSCGARYDVARELISDGTMMVLCGMCGHAAKAGTFQGDDAPPEETPAERALRESTWPRVVVGHEVPAAARSIAQVLRQGNYAPVCVRSGEQVLAACDPSMPAPVAAVVLDVAIPGVLAFEVLEQMRAHPGTKEIPVILLASVFERTRYKRRPTNLYGADAYLELHHVPDKLHNMIEMLRAKKEIPPDRLQAPVERARAASLRNSPAVEDPETAHALARRLLSDVALYHGDEIADGVRKGNPFVACTSAVDTARDLFKAALTGGPDRLGVFDDELHRFSSRLLERGGRSG